MSQLHQRPRSKASLSDEYETPVSLFNELCTKYQQCPQTDAAANEKNTKCGAFLTDIATLGDVDRGDIWCNPPHSMNGYCVKLCHDYWKKWNRNVMMILPTNTMSSIYWHELIENKGHYHPIKGRIKFLVNGEQSKHQSRNAYCVVVWNKV